MFPFLVMFVHNLAATVISLPKSSGIGGIPEDETN